MEPMVNIALRAAREAGRIIVRAYDDLARVKIYEKALNDYVTQADLAAERVIIKALQKAYPDHDITSEEAGHTQAGPEPSEYCWIIDPLDGTTNFMRHIPQFCIAIALQKRGRIEHAVIVDPINNEEFTASRGCGAMLNDKRIRVGTHKALDHAMVAVGGGVIHQANPAHLQARTHLFANLIARQCRLRHSGSAALDLAYVAAGRLDAVCFSQLQPWDMAAGILLMTEAGALVGDFNGEHQHLEKGQVVGGNPKLFKSVVQLTNTHTKS